MLALTVLWPSAVGAEENAPGQLLTIRPVQRTIVFGTVERLTPKGQKLAGLDDGAFDQDIAEVVAQAAGLPFRFVEKKTSAEVMEAFLRGEIDVIPSLPRTAAFEEKMLFSLRHTVSTIAVFMKADAVPPRSVAEVGKLRLVAAENSSSAAYLKGKGWLDRAQVLPTSEEALRAVLAGAAEAWLSNQLVGLSLLRGLQLQDKIRPEYTLPDYAVDYCMAVRKGDAALLTRLNDGILLAIERGDLQRRREKWMPVFESYWLSRPATKRALLLGGIGLVAAAALFWLWYRYRLRAAQARTAEVARLVEERTQELARANDQLRASQKELHELNAALESRVARRTEELAHRVEEVERLNQELESFSYSVSHDLRAPLRNITGFLELLTRHAAGKLDAEETRYVGTVNHEVARMGRLIDELLELSRLSRAPLTQEVVDLGALVAAVREEVAREPGPAQVEWVIGPLPAVRADRLLLHQAFANLLSNALKFSRHRNPARIEISARPAPDRGWIECAIRDNGAGFNPKYADKLFGVFQRLHNQRDFEGTGIGLANVKRIVTRHGGKIRADGQPDAGATFTFTLPAPE